MNCLLDIAAALGGLSLPGVANRTLGETPTSLEREYPALTRSTHDPDFITDLAIQQVTAAGNNRSDYTLNYKFYFAPVGKDRGLFAGEVENLRQLQAVVGEMLRDRRLGGAKYLALASLPTFRTVTDAAGKEYHGAVISLRVTEF